MGSLDQTNALRLVTLFAATVKGMSLYPASHPAIRQSLAELYTILSAALRQEERVSWGLIDGMMFLDDHLFTVPSSAIADLTNHMEQKFIGRIVATAECNFESVEAFIKLFTVKGIHCDVLSRQMKENGITGLTLVRQGDESFDVDNTTLEDDTTNNHAKTYNQALSAVKTICRDIERGRIPSSGPLISIVDQMVQITMQEPWAMLGLTLINDYDNYTFNHCVNVGVLSMALGTSLGMNASNIKDLGIAGLLHDIGKTMIPKDILNKPGKLSSAEYDEMKRHPELGSKIIIEMEGLAPHISSVVLGHHLHYNRSGYPEWASNLPFTQMVDIVAIADTYDAITTLRVYQHPVNPNAALGVMQKMTNTILDGSIVERFIEMMGNYPVGTLVRLDTNEIAIVYRPNPLDENAPLVRILFDSDGKRLPAPLEQALVEPDGTVYAEIVAVVDPLLKNIDVGQLVMSMSH
jgi:HD-GYP domain-containing protein (c-di-GMP phosphodiesterase class II)